MIDDGNDGDTDDPDDVKPEHPILHDPPRASRFTVLPIVMDPLIRLPPDEDSLPENPDLYTYQLVPVHPTRKRFLNYASNLVM